MLGATGVRCTATGLRAARGAVVRAALRDALPERADLAAREDREGALPVDRADRGAEPCRWPRAAFRCDERGACRDDLALLDDRDLARRVLCRAWDDRAGARRAFREDERFGEPASTSVALGSAIRIAAHTSNMRRLGNIVFMASPLIGHTFHKRVLYHRRTISTR